MLTSAQPNMLLSLGDPSRLGISATDVGSVACLVAFALFLILEVRFGYRKIPARTTRQSYLANLGTFLMNDTLMSLMSVSSLLMVAEKFGHWGLLSQVSDPILKTALSFVLFDLTLYLWHRANHTFECLWMFHKVHHSDPSMNVSTAFRLHFVEVVLTTVIKAVFVVLTGVEATVLLANEMLITLLVMFHHANLKFSGERSLASAIIVPYLHRIHHSTVRKEHDNNYGAMFSFWDRLFGTFTDREPVAIGLESIPGMGVLDLVKFGLTRTWTPGPEAVTMTPSPQLMEKMIAEAAYYRAKERNFAPGFDYTDWLEAEREIRSRLTPAKQSSPRQGKSLLVCCK